MKINRVIPTIILLAISAAACAQNAFRGKVVDEKTKEPLIGASANMEELKIGAVSDSNRLITIGKIPNGKFEISFRYIGYKEKKEKFSFPLTNPNEIIEVDLEPQTLELEEIVIQTTRSSRTIEDIPTKVDIVSAE